MREDPSTLRITAKDIDAGWIRIPNSAKRLLAADRADTVIRLRGATLRAWMEREARAAGTLGQALHRTPHARWVRRGEEAVGEKQAP